MSETTPPPKGQKGWPVYRRLLVDYSASYWPYFLICLFGYVLYALTQTGLAHLMKYFVDGLESGDESMIYFVPIAAIALTIFRGIGYFCGSFFISKIALNVINDLRKQLFDHLLQLPSNVHDSRNSGELISMITYNVTQVSSAATQAVKVIFREGFMVIALMAYLLYQNWQLTILFILIAPVLGGLISVASKHFRRLSKKMQASMGQVTHISNEAIQGYRIVRSYGGEQYEHERFHQASDNNTTQGIKYSFVSAIQTPILQFMVAAALAGIMFLVLYMAKSSQATTGELVAYVTAAGLIAKPVRTLSEVNAIIQKGIAAAESVFYMLDSPVEENHGTLEVARVKGRIELQNVSFAYESDQPVLSDINLVIEPGETVALVGRSGSGKSTLTNLLLRFYGINSGKIFFDDVESRDFEISNLRNQIALVNQHVVLFNDTVARNIAYGQLAKVDDSVIKKAATDAHAMEFIETLPDGLQTLVGEDGTLLSGGQRQRLSIARALLKDAPILILDEATSALDTESERLIQDALDTVMVGRTTIVIAHRLSTIEKADRIVVMDKGRIVEQGAHAELMAKAGHYARLHEIQFSDE